MLTLILEHCPLPVGLALVLLAARVQMRRDALRTTRRG